MDEGAYSVDAMLIIPAFLVSTTHKPVSCKYSICAAVALNLHRRDVIF